MCSPPHLKLSIQKVGKVWSTQCLDQSYPVLKECAQGINHVFSLRLNENESVGKCAWKSQGRLWCKCLKFIESFLLPYLSKCTGMRGHGLGLLSVKAVEHSVCGVVYA